MVEEIGHIRKKAIKAQAQIIVFKQEVADLKAEKDAIENNFYFILIEAIDKEEEQANPNQNNIGLITALLEKMEVIRLEAPINKIPEYCKTVRTIKDNTKINGTVVNITKHGYRKGKIIIRKTHVVIVEN